MELLLFISSICAHLFATKNCIIFTLRHSGVIFHHQVLALVGWCDIRVWQRQMLKTIESFTLRWQNMNAAVEMSRYATNQTERQNKQLVVKCFIQFTASTTELSDRETWTDRWLENCHSTKISQQLTSSILTYTRPYQSYSQWWKTP